MDNKFLIIIIIVLAITCIFTTVNLIRYQEFSNSCMTTLSDCRDTLCYVMYDCYDNDLCISDIDDSWWDSTFNYKDV